MDMVPTLEHFGVVRAWCKPLGQATCAQLPFSAAAREKGRLQISDFRDDWYVECKNSRNNHFWPKKIFKKGHKFPQMVFRIYNLSSCEQPIHMYPQF